MREDATEEAVQASLSRIQLSNADAVKLENKWKAALDDKTPKELRQSLELQLAQERAKMELLVDLLVDDSIDKPMHVERKLKIQLNIKKPENSGMSAAQTADLLELFKTLTQLHFLGNAATKRRIVQNCFSNRTVVERDLSLEPYDWLREARNFELSPVVTQYDPLLELLHSFRSSEGGGLDQAA